MSNNTLHPWLEKYWQQVLSLKEQARLPHALMLRGTDGLGIEQLASVIGNSLLCKERTTEGFSCGHCSDCHVCDRV